MTSRRSLSIAFAGTPAFAVPALEALIADGYRVGPVLTQPDRRAGRGRALTPSPVKELARSHGIDVLQPTKPDAVLRDSLPPARPDFLVVIAYGLILPDWLLVWPEVAPVNVHASLLPRWRGASPIQQAVLAGDRDSGVSIMRMTAGLDTGPVYCRASTPIGARETAGSLHDRLAALGAETLVDALPAIAAGTLTTEPQDESAACYAPKIDKRDALIDWSRPAREIERRVRAYQPWPVAESTTVAGERLRIWEAELGPRETAAAPGSVVATDRGAIEVATGDGVLVVTRLQPPGGRAMSAKSYLAAHDLSGAVFGAPR